MEWDAPAIILDVRPYGEGDAVAAVMTEAHGLHRGLARGGASRGKAGTWQPGNMVQVQWKARLSDQLGTFTGELIHAGASHAMQEAMPLSMLTAICAVAEGALPEREPMPRIFAGLLRLIPRLPLGEQLLAELIRWELVVLSDLGYGLDLSACAVTGRTGGLAHVSPRTGRAVTHEGAGQWAARLLPLPAFLVDTPSGDLADTPRGVLVNAPRGVLVNAPRGVPVNAPRGVLADTPPGDPVDTPPDYAGWRDGLRLTGHFLARDAFGHQHRPLPQARAMLYDRVAALAVKHGAAPLEAAEQEKDDTSNNAG